MSKKLKVMIDGAWKELSESELLDEIIGKTAEELDKLILKALTIRPMTVTDLAKRIGSKYNTVSNRIADIKAEGKLKRKGLLSKKLVTKTKLKHRAIYTLSEKTFDTVEEMIEETELPSEAEALEKFIELKKKDKKSNESSEE